VREESLGRGLTKRRAVSAAARALKKKKEKSLEDRLGGTVPVRKKKNQGNAWYEARSERRRDQVESSREEKKEGS